VNQEISKWDKPKSTVERNFTCAIFFFEAGTAPNLIPKRDGVTDCIAEFNADYTSSVNY
jgi:hypothetical protein